MRVCVVGLGKIGLPLAVQYAINGFDVVGCDINQRVVNETNAGRTSITGEPELSDRLATVVASGSLRAEADSVQAVSVSDIVVMVPPVLLDASNRPDFSSFDEAARSVGKGVRTGALVVLETTVPVGTTRTRLMPVLNATSGMEAGVYFQLAYSPERVSSGSIFRDLHWYPKLVGGIDSSSSDEAEKFYRKALGAEVISLPDPETAEFAKLAESVYRDVNIALANELAVLAENAGINAAVAFAASNTQPYSHLHQPGVGVGGHCIPVYPYFMWDQTSAPSVIRSARGINDAMAMHAVELLEAALVGLRGRRVLILGLSYRADVPEHRYSSTYLLNSALRAKGADVFVHDPLFDVQQIAALGLTPQMTLPDLECDAVIVQAFHSAYQALDFRAFERCRVVMDGRSAIDPDVIRGAGMRYIGIGRGDLVDDDAG